MQDIIMHCVHAVFAFLCSVMLFFLCRHLENARYLRFLGLSWAFTGFGYIYLAFYLYLAGIAPNVVQFPAFSFVDTILSIPGSLCLFQHTIIGTRIKIWGEISMPASTPTLQLRHWYLNGLRFSCLQCHRCCRATQVGWTYVNNREVKRLARWLDLSLKSFKRRYLAKDPDSEIVLKAKPNGDCTFWQDGCAIYPVRPRLCRTFPFWPENLESPEAWEAVKTYCRGTGSGKLYRYEEIRAIVYGRATGCGRVSQPNPYPQFDHNPRR